MSGDPKGWWARHIDTLYRLLLLALIMLWVVYPPHVSEPRGGQLPVSLTAISRP